MAYSIAIVGCGVAGLTAALLLARDGHRITLLEQSTHVGPVGAGVLLQPSGQLVLRQMGLIDRVTARAASISRLYAKTHRGHRLVDLPYAAVEPGMTAYGLHRGDLFLVLHGEVVSSGVRIELNCKISRVVESADDVELFDGADTSRGTFDLLLAADGARSTLRGAIGLPAAVYRYPHGALWALGTCTTVSDHLLQVTHGTRQLGGLLPMGEGRCSLFWSLECASRETLFAGGVESWRNEVTRLIPQAAEVLAGLTSFSDVRFSTYVHVRMKRWHTRRCLLLGDAAHAMSPHLGQGINLALIDGLTIAHAFGCTTSPDKAFALYSELRRAHTDFYARVTYLLSPFFQSRGMIKGVLRDIGLPSLHAMPIIGKQMLLTMSGLKRSVFGGHMQLPGTIQGPL